MSGNNETQLYYKMYLDPPNSSPSMDLSIFIDQQEFGIMERQSGPSLPSLVLDGVYLTNKMTMTAMSGDERSRFKYK